MSQTPVILALGTFLSFVMGGLMVRIVVATWLNRRDAAVGVIGLSAGLAIGGMTTSVWMFLGSAIAVLFLSWYFFYKERING